MSRKGLLAAAAISLLCATGAMAQTSSDGTAGGSGVTLADGANGSAKPMHRHFAHMRDPAAAKNMCIEHFARSTGRLAYLEAKLQLTADQKPLWDKWEEATAAGNATMRDDCIAGVPAKDTPSTALDRDSRVEKLLTDKLDTLKTARPALEALYQSLSPEQRIAFDQSTKGRHKGMGGPRWQHHGQDGYGQDEVSPG
jgi:hypothetical protein